MRYWALHLNNLIKRNDTIIDNMIYVIGLFKKKKIL